MVPQSDPSPEPQLPDPKTQQEIINLRLAEEKLRQELLDLRRPYLLRNAQLLTALITSIGAIIGVSLLIEENYFKTREQRNAFQEEQTKRLNADAKDAVEKAAQAKKDADTMTAAAETAKAEADKKVSRSNQQTEEAKARAAAATEILDGIKAELDSDEFATKAEQLVALGNASAAREAALAAWGRKHTNAAKKAIVDAYSLPVMEPGGTPTQSAKRRFRLTASAS